MTESKMQERGDTGGTSPHSNLPAEAARVPPLPEAHHNHAHQQPLEHAKVHHPHHHQRQRSLHRQKGSHLVHQQAPPSESILQLSLTDSTEELYPPRHSISTAPHGSPLLITAGQHKMSPLAQDARRSYRSRPSGNTRTYLLSSDCEDDVFIPNGSVKTGSKCQIESGGRLESPSSRQWPDGEDVEKDYLAHVPEYCSEETLNMSGSSQSISRRRPPGRYPPHHSPQHSPHQNGKVNTCSHLQSGQVVTKVRRSHGNTHHQKSPDEPAKDTDTPGVPDGGWGWVVVMGLLITSILDAGLSGCFTIIFVALGQRFDSSAASTAWVYSITMATAMLTGPLAGALIQQVGCRRCVMVASLVQACGLILTGFAPSLYIVYFTMGVLSGLPSAVFITAMISIIGQYFEKKRARATSLAVFGRGVGVIIFAPMLERLFNYYGFSGTFLILGGLVLNNIAVGMLMRPPPQEKKVVVVKHEEPQMELEVQLNAHQTGDRASILREHHQEEPLKRRLVRSLSRSFSQQNADINGNIQPSGGLLPLPSPHAKDIPEEETMSSASSSSSICSLSSCSICSRRRRRQRSCSQLVHAFGLHLLKEPAFLTLAIHFTLFSIAVSAFGVCLASLIAERGLPDHTVVLGLALFGALGLITRPLSGLLFDHHLVAPVRRHLYALLVLLAAGALSFVPLICDVTSFLLVVLIFGVFSSMITTQGMVICGDVVPRRYLANGAGICNAFSGIGILIGPPMAGLVHDQMGTYVVVYQLLAVFVFLSFLVIEPYNIYRYFCVDNKSNSQTKNSGPSEV